MIRMPRHLWTVWMTGIGALIASGAAVADDIGRPVQWALNFTDNAELPPSFRQFSIPREDGSTLTGYLGVSAEGPERKPLLIWLDGSGAQSHFVRVGDKIGVGLFGLLARDYGDRYHVATIEKRGVDFAFQLERPGGAMGAPEEYQQHATLANRAADAQRLIRALSDQAPVDSSRILVIGHSEGADVAASVAALEDRVTHVGFLAGGGAAQFFDFFVDRRKQMTAQGIAPEQIEASIQELEGEIRSIMAKPDSTSDFWLGHAYKRWAGFAGHATSEDLARCRAKVFLAHGSRDQAVPIESFDYTVMRLLVSGRDGVTVRRYPGCDHGFGLPGEPPGMAAVIGDVIAWAEAQ